MLRRPDVEEVLGYGRALGFDLTPTEARIIQSRMVDTVAALEAFDELRVEERRPPLRITRRDPGARPTEAEDPLNIFIRRCRVEGAAGGPLAGKTIGLKDHIALAGVPLTFSSHMMDGFVPDFDATIVTRVLDAGATITGKLKMEEFSWGGPGLSGVGDYGRPLNPHHHDHVTGGSSSGSGAAVAGGAVDIAFGGDQGGSIRLPAAWCGCVGLMPTHGLVPHTGVFGLEPTIDYVGPMARTVDDVAAVLACVAGPDGFDPRQAQVPARLPPYTEALSRGVKGLRIGILEEGFGVAGGEPDVDESVMGAIRALERLGARTERVSVPLHSKASLALLPIYLEGGKRMYDTNLGGAFAKTYYPSALISIFGRLKQSHGREFSPNLKLNLLQGHYLQQHYSGRLYAKAQNVRPTFAAQYDRVFAGVDLLAMPTIPLKAPRWREPRDHEDALELTMLGGNRGLDLGPVIANTCPFNYTGHPALSIPCGKSNGLPIGLMLVAPYFREDVLFQAAAAYQQSVDWAALIRTPAAGARETSP
ncbi:MAG: amidase [Candidatus Rokubacteria bacterium]|nr:amidase [Candidatus Rokubacteria bacterium]